jgi:endo-cleaving rubber dioxygenase
MLATERTTHCRGVPHALGPATRTLDVPRCCLLLVLMVCASTSACSATPSSGDATPDNADAANTGAHGRNQTDSSIGMEAGKSDSGASSSGASRAGNAAGSEPSRDVSQSASGDDGYPLLGSTRGGHVWSRFCANNPDDAALPVDPRTLVQPGVNVGKAAAYNAYWVDCREGAAPEDAPPKTCGEYRARFERGKDMMENGKLWFFGGNYTDSAMSFSADQYNALWLRWGYVARPANFDELVAQRWGVPLGSKRNPYPLPGEDPNLTSGGSGQLPVALTQMREPDGRYTGRLAMTCNWCHSGAVGDASEGPGLGAIYGNGNSLVEIGAHFADAMPITSIAANKVRGSGDVLIYPAIAAFDVDRLARYDSLALIVAPSGGSVDFPVWWNVGHRTRRFHDGSFAMDDARPVMGFFMPILSQSHLADIAFGREWIEKYDQDIQLWLESLTAPAYPGRIDRKLAEQGAVLFHNKNLWASDLRNPVPRPSGGNGSCATCHGVYSPRYVHDSNYLDRPELEGIAAHVVPLEVIGTDPARLSSLNEGLQQNLQWTWWAYGTTEAPGKCFDVIEPAGYLAPPLYGVWATAPYFHNGSVPNVWEVLQPLDRKAIWRRASAPAPDGDPSAVMGYDTNLARAYDHERLGWKYAELPCGTALEPAVDCTPGAAEANPASTLWFSWNLDAAPITAAELEQRKIYSSHKYSQGNRGHEFTQVLTDSERKALIEYLKTL